MKGVQWDDLRYFLALSRGRTASAAGRELEVKHTTVSRRVKALEATLGSRLFDHLSEGYILTPAGESLYRHALIVEEQVQAIEREVLGLDTQLQGPLILTAAHDVFSRLIAAHLGEFRQTWPGIDLQLFVSTGLADLGARQADIALRLTPKPPDYLIGRKVMPLGIGLYASRQYLADNPDHRHLVLWNDEIEKPAWAKQSFPGAEVVIRADDVTSLLACLESHLGITMLPCYLGDSSPALRRLDLPLAASSWGVWVLSHVDLRTTARVRVCRQFLVEILERQRALIEGRESDYWRD